MVILTLFSFTFDDGNSSQIRDYYPILRKYHFPATFYVTTAEIGRPGKLSAKDLNLLVHGKNEIGSHGWTHRPLLRLNLSQLRDELAKSYEFLKPFRARSFAYPYGKYNKRIASEVARYYDSARGHTKNIAANKAGSLNKYSLLSFSVDGKFGTRIRADALGQMFSNKRLFQPRDWMIIVLHGRTSPNVAGIKSLLKPERFTPEQARGIILDIRARITTSQRGTLTDFENLCAHLAERQVNVATVSEAIEQFD